MELRKHLRKIALAARLSRTKKVTLGKRTYRIRGLFVNKLALKDIGSAEPWLDPVYEAALKLKSGVFVDVGVNLGQTLIKILALDHDRRYLGFEPQVSCCFLVQQFLEDNQLKDHTVLPVGLSNRNQTLEMFLRDGGGDSTASVVRGFRPQTFYTSHRYVLLRKGDEVISEVEPGSCCAIKIDVEGAELDVVEGLSHTIQEDQPILIFEVLNHFLAVSGEALDESTVRFREDRIRKLEALLRGLAYEVYNIRPGNRLKKVDRIEPLASSDLSLTNYVAISKTGLDGFRRVYAGSVE